MTYTIAVTVRRVLLAGVALLAVCAAPAAQAAPGTGHGAGWLHLTVTREAAAPQVPGTRRTAGPRSGATRDALLLCDPPRGHRQAAEACAELTAAGGDIHAIPPREGALCPMIYAPVTARAQGRWHGRPVDYRETFSNECAMKARTGQVFALDE